MTALLLATVMSFTLPTQQGDCLPNGVPLRQLDSVRVWYQPVGHTDSLLAFGAYVIRMEGNTLSVGVPLNTQFSAWVLTHNPRGWSCGPRFTFNAGLGVPVQARGGKPGVAYDVRGAIADTTLPGVYFTVRGNRIVRTVVVR